MAKANKSVGSLGFNNAESTAPEPKVAKPLAKKKETLAEMSIRVKALAEQLNRIEERASKVIPPSVVSPVSKMEFGVRFKRGSEVFIRTRPTSYLLNSSLISRALSDGKSLIVNLESGSLFIVEGSEIVIPV